MSVPPLLFALLMWFIGTAAVVWLDSRPAATFRTSLTLAGLGVYGVTARSVEERSRELGVRQALGASPAGLLRLVVGQALRVVVIGLAVGAALATGAVSVLLNTLPNAYSPNQYANPRNPAAHENTMREIAEALDGQVDFLFVAASTFGTLRGCVGYLRAQDMKTRVVAVDAAGSILFQPKPGPRLIPGHGAAIKPALLDTTSSPPAAATPSAISSSPRG